MKSKQPGQTLQAPEEEEEKKGRRKNQPDEHFLNRFYTQDFSCRENDEKKEGYTKMDVV